MRRESPSINDAADVDTRYIYNCVHLSANRPRARPSLSLPSMLHSPRICSNLVKSLFRPHQAHQIGHRPSRFHISVIPSLPYHDQPPLRADVYIPLSDVSLRTMYDIQISALRSISYIKLLEALQATSERPRRRCDHSHRSL